MILFGRKRQKVQTLQEEIHKWVTARNLTLEELKASKLPDNSLTAILVDFISPAGRSYKAVHNNSRLGPYILLARDEKNDKVDFSNVEDIVTKEVRGKLESRNFLYGTSDTWRKIYLKGNLTQSRVASCVEKYKKHFEDVNIILAQFQDILKSAYEDSGLPLEKLKPSII